MNGSGEHHERPIDGEGEGRLRRTRVWNIPQVVWQMAFTCWLALLLLPFLTVFVMDPQRRLFLMLLLPGYGVLRALYALLRTPWWLDFGISDLRLGALVGRRQYTWDEVMSVRPFQLRLGGLEAMVPSGLHRGMWIRTADGRLVTLQLTRRQAVKAAPFVAPHRNKGWRRPRHRLHLAVEYVTWSVLIVLFALGFTTA